MFIKICIFLMLFLPFAGHAQDYIPYISPSPSPSYNFNPDPNQELRKIRKEQQFQMEMLEIEQNKMRREQEYEIQKLRNEQDRMKLEQEKRRLGVY
jgi:hypothetical protein